MSPDPLPPAPVRMVTIAATYGAGGGVVARLLSRRLGLPFADRLSATRELPRLPSEAAGNEDHDDTPRRSFLNALALLSADSNIPTPTDATQLPAHVREQIHASLEILLDDGGAVVFGRAAAIALGRRPGVFHVRLDGPAPRRAERGALWEGIDVATARRHLDETDTSRDRYVRRLYNVDPADPALYHLVIDSTAVSVDACVELITSAVEAASSFDDRRLPELVVETRRRLQDPG